jgi:uncharacterized protein YgbK (DUF1537 family)
VPWLSAVRASSVLVVCGSLDPGARQQLVVLGRAGLDGVTVVTSPADVNRPVAARAAEAMAATLAAETHELLDAQRPDVVVVLGGDTTAGVLGDAVIAVTGLLAPGTPVGRWLDGTGPIVVTRSGSFGESSALHDLLVLMLRGAFG